MIFLKSQCLIVLVCILNVSFISSADTQIKYLCPEIRPTNCANVSGSTCGYFNKSVQCIKSPCAQQYKNPCEACADAKVEYISCGKCIADTTSAKSDIKIVKNKFKLPLCLDVNVPNVAKE